MTPAEATPSGWPFWAATTTARIDDALAMAGLRPGERLLDLGCGDGRVLVRAAAGFGAAVAGVELDPRLAEVAREVLEATGIDGEIVEADFEDVAIDADVVFAYLSPATLERLRPRLEALPPGARVVTTGYAVPGWFPHDVGDRIFLYRMPPQVQEHDRQERGWISFGALISAPADAPSLVAVRCTHPGGPVDAHVHGEDLEGWLTLRAGTERAEPGDRVTIDLRLDPRPAGTIAAGTLHAPGIEQPFVVFVVADDGDSGIWGLSDAGCRHVVQLAQSGALGPFLDEVRRNS
jgi:SAM-dependent methyltransferase